MLQTISRAARTEGRRSSADGRMVRKRSKTRLAAFRSGRLPREQTSSGVSDGDMPAPILAVGDIADGVVAIGGVSRGIISIGGLAAGVVALGGISVGLLAALGGLAAAPYAMGGVALGAFRGGAYASLGSAGNS